MLLIIISSVYIPNLCTSFPNLTTLVLIPSTFVLNISTFVLNLSTFVPILSTWWLWMPCNHWAVGFCKQGLKQVLKQGLKQVYQNKLKTILTLVSITFEQWLLSQIVNVCLYDVVFWVFILNVYWFIDCW